MLLDKARERIQAAGHPLQITSEPAGETEAPHSSEMQFKWAIDALSWHFADIPLNKLMTTVRLCPGHRFCNLRVLGKVCPVPDRID
ncbi:hypothetical protein [Bradyrhizobium sp. Arg816]|uniref:hypothetical protein n=1 Tax=Bradyrhizobium sp. Arg816 TaxID=2998491 RepID=UPI00249E674A|nr:hypothetical protein [Bradyrhizobium sp. Arg816]MDI3567360.1 hypothetical protein [Bradyrhizobium sp. Arg816]